MPQSHTADQPIAQNTSSPMTKISVLNQKGEYISI